MKQIVGLTPEAWREIQAFIRQETGRQSPIQNPIRRKHVRPSASTDNTFILPMKSLFVVQTGPPVTSATLSTYTASYSNVGFFIPNIDSDLDICGGAVSVVSSGDPVAYPLLTINHNGVYEFEFHAVFDIAFTGTSSGIIYFTAPATGGSAFQNAAYSLDTDQAKITVVAKLAKYYAAGATVQAQSVFLPSGGSLSNHVDMTFASRSYSQPYWKISKICVESDAVSACNFV